MINYNDHDIGYLKPGGLHSSESTGEIPQGYYKKVKGQVYQATHDGELRLPFMYRSFISFSFGGKNIQDFGIIRVTEGQRMQSNLYTEFEDLTQEYDVLHGQFYWGTHFKPLILQYLLSTDGMTQTQMDKFKAWFAPGKMRQLIRAEHPNRGILARVQTPPVMNMLAFQGSQKKSIAGTIYEIPTTLYKGDIKVSFVCDDPFWYSIQNLLGKRYIVTLKNDGTLQWNGQSDAGYGTQQLQENQFYQYGWVDVNDNKVLLMNDPDVLKIILQDNIPSANMIKIYQNLFLGGDVWVKDRQYYDATHNVVRTVAALASPQNGSNPPYAEVQVSRVGVTYAPAVGTFTFMGSGNNGTGVNLSGGKNGNVAYLYYAGNAPSYPTLYFTIIPQLIDPNEGQIPYIKYPANKYVAEAFPEVVEKTYNTITIESKEKHEFRFTTPSAWNGYNQALYWFNKLAYAKDPTSQTIVGSSWQDVKTYLKDKVTHPGARTYAVEIVQQYLRNDLNGMLTENNLSTIFGIMKGFIFSGSSCYSSTFSINSKNGVCVGKIQYKKYGQNQVEEQIENVGDMVRSTYLFLQETNCPLQESGTIEEWNANNEKTKQCVHIIYSDCPIINFGIEYKNMYY